MPPPPPLQPLAKCQSTDTALTVRGCVFVRASQEEAVEESQQYKVGKYILEKTKLTKKTDLQ